MPKPPHGVAKPWNINLANLYTRKTLRSHCARLQTRQGASIYTATNVGNILDGETLQRRCARCAIPQNATWGRKPPIAQCARKQISCEIHRAMPKSPEDVAKPWNVNLANLYTRKTIQVHCARLGVPQGAPIYTATGVGKRLDGETLPRCCARCAIPPGARKGDLTEGVYNIWSGMPLLKTNIRFCCTT